MNGDTAAAFAKLVAVLGGGQLTALIADLEAGLVDAGAGGATAAGSAAGIDPPLLGAALLVRRDVGRLNDLIHACAITLSLPKILSPNERIICRPSLAAGNDPTRKYDLETDQRVAEFKLAHSQWSGADAMRKRTLFRDLVHLAAADGGRRAELYVVGQAPIRFLRTTKAKVSWALDRGPESTRRMFEQRFGPLSLPVAEFTAGLASHVHLIDLTELLPEVAAAERRAPEGRSGAGV
jgi:hypothetical protein